jgi:uncharacterized protein YbjT (DUF2867 family)
MHFNLKSLVTGGSGFLGSHLVEALVKRGEHVRALVRPTSKTKHLEQLGVELYSGDLGDINSLKNAAQGVDRVYHCAALAADWGSWEEFDKINKDLNYTPNVNFEEGMQHVKDWLLQIDYIKGTPPS